MCHYSVGYYSKVDSHEYFAMVKTGASAATGTVYSIEGGRFQNDNGIDICKQELFRIQQAIAEKHPSLVKVQSQSDISADYYEVLHCGGKHAGFIPGLTLCDGRYIGLTCGVLLNSQSESPTEANKSALSILYSRSTEETRPFWEERRALRDSLWDKSMKKKGFDKSEL